MNNTVLTTALLTILSTAAYADNSVQLPTPLNAAKPMATAPGTIQPSLQSAPQPAAVVNCKYHIPAEKNNIEQPLITSWAGKAAVQSFEFNPANHDVITKASSSAVFGCSANKSATGINNKSANFSRVASEGKCLPRSNLDKVSGSMPIFSAN